MLSQYYSLAEVLWNGARCRCMVGTFWQICQMLGSPGHEKTDSDSIVASRQSRGLVW